MNMVLDINKDLIENIQKGDTIFYAEYESSKNEVKIKSLQIKEIYGKKDHIEGVNSESFLCDLIDKDFPKVTIKKTDISRGYYKSKKEALEVLTLIIGKIYQACQDAFSKI